FVPLHAPPEVGEEVDRDDRGGVTPVLKDRAMGIEHRIEPRRVIDAQAAPEHQVLATGHDVDGVDLDAPEPPHRIDGLLPGWRLSWGTGQPLGCDRQLTRLFPRQLDHVPSSCGHSTLIARPLYQNI